MGVELGGMGEVVWVGGGEVTVGEGVVGAEDKGGMAVCRRVE